MDEEGEQYETYFLSMTDEADLLAAAEAAGVEPVSYTHLHGYFAGYAGGFGGPAGDNGAGFPFGPVAPVDLYRLYHDRTEYRDFRSDFCLLYTSFPISSRKTKG